MFDRKKLDRLEALGVTLENTLEMIEQGDACKYKENVRESLRIVSGWLDRIRKISSAEEYNDLWREIRPSDRYLLDYWGQPEYLFRAAETAFDTFWNYASEIAVDVRTA